MPRGYLSPGRLGTIGGGRLYLLNGGGWTIVPFTPLKWVVGDDDEEERFLMASSAFTIRFRMSF